MEQPFKKPPFWAETGPQFTRCNELDTFLRMSSFAWHAELACRKWLERGSAFAGGLNTPKTTAWMSLLSYLNPPLAAGEEFGISPDDEPEVAILRAYQLLLTGLSVESIKKCGAVGVNKFLTTAGGTSTDAAQPNCPTLFDALLVIERLNAWLDGFKTLLVRYETSLQNWLAFHWLAFTALLLRKIAPATTS